MHFCYVESKLKKKSFQILWQLKKKKKNLVENFSGPLKFEKFSNLKPKKNILKIEKSESVFIYFM